MSRTKRAARSITWHRAGAPKGYYAVVYLWWSRDFVSLDPKTDQKLIRKLHWEDTKEGHVNERSPGNRYRIHRHKQLRRMAKEEIHRFKMLEDYEPMVLSDPISCLWDWR